MVGAAAGRSRPSGIVQLRPSSGRGSPRWRSPRVAGPLRTTRGHSGSSGGQLSCGTQCATRERQAASPAAGLRGGGLSEWQAPPRATRGHSGSSLRKSRPGPSGCGHEATPAGGGTDSARPRSSGVSASGNDGPCPAGSHQSESDLVRVGRGTSTPSAGRGTDVLGGRTPAGRGPEAHWLLETTPKGCTPQRRLATGGVEI